MKNFNALILTGAVLLLALTVLAVNIFGPKESEQGVFNPGNISRPAQPLTLDPGNATHGHISLDYVIHINDFHNDRFPFTFREMHTAVWLVEELLAMGYTHDDISIQEFTYGGIRSLYNTGFIMEFFYFINNSPFADFGFRPSRQSQNIILTVPGQSDEVIIVGAHYDSVFHPGASDNASGTALLLESARRMFYLDNYYTIEYVFFGAEEMGLFGSLYYVDDLTQAEHDNILFMINADILLDGDDLLYMAGYDANGSPGVNQITREWDLIADEINARYDLDLIPLPHGVFGPSDHLAFLPFGHTAMFLAGLEVGDVPHEIVPYTMTDLARVVHSPRDNIHYILNTWPDKAERNMRTFTIFLEEILLTTYHTD